MVPPPAALVDAASSAPPPGDTAAAIVGLFAGLFATALGLLIATNYRGFLDRFLAASEEGVAPLRRVPPWRWIPESRLDDLVRRQRPMFRIMGSVFAVVGPLLLIGSAVHLLTSPWRLGHIGAKPDITAFGVTCGVLILGGQAAMWRRGTPGLSLFRDAWSQGRVLPRVAALGASLAALIMAAGVGLQLVDLFFAGWALAVIPAIALALTWHRSPAPPVRTEEP